MKTNLVRLYTEGEDDAVREKRTLLCWFLIYGMKHDREFINALITFSQANGTEPIQFSGYMAWVISYGFIMDQNPDIQKQWIEDFMRESLEAYEWGGEALNIDAISVQQLRVKKAELEGRGGSGSISCGKGIAERTLYAISRVLSREHAPTPKSANQESEVSANDRRRRKITNWNQEYFNSDRGDGPMTEDAFRKFVQGKIAEATQPSDTLAKWEASLNDYIAEGVNDNGSNDLFYGGKRIRKTSKRRRTKRKGKSSRKF